MRTWKKQDRLFEATLRRDKAKRDREHAQWAEAMPFPDWEATTVCPQTGVRITPEMRWQIVWEACMRWGCTPADFHKMQLKCITASRNAKSKLKKELRDCMIESGDISTQMITLSIDKQVGEIESIEAQRKTIDVIKTANYKYIREGKARYVFEYYSDDGKWNPHVHIVIHKTQSDGAIRQSIYRKFMTGKKPVDSVYNIDVTGASGTCQLDYVTGEKKDSKKINVEKDIEFRLKHLVDDFYYF